VARERRASDAHVRGLLVIDDLKKGYYLLFIDGGKRANEQGQAEGAIGVILKEPDCGAVLATVAEKVGPVGSPHEAEYHALSRRSSPAPTSDPPIWPFRSSAAAGRMRLLTL
jgi:hypothetical protein